MKIAVLALAVALGGCASMNAPLASISEQPVAANVGICPGAYINYDYWHRRYRDATYVPVQVQVQAVSALSACKKAGIKGLPITVAEYNRQPPAIDGREWARQADKELNPRPLGEF